MDETPLGKAILWLATAIAIAGGSVLVLITIITVISVIGRALIPLGLSPVHGDYEIVQTGVLFAIFCAMPLTQYLRGHADVSVLTDFLPARPNAIIELVMDVLMLIASSFILWRFAIGMLDKLGNREMTFILHMPIWWSYAAGMLGAVGMVVVAAYCVVRSFVNATSADPKKPEPGIF
ncbi:MAG TPA: TRAP transporter small permease [Devosia sp.]|nr:TRAP transporter small permease [Devosia sp.]